MASSSDTYSKHGYVIALGGPGAQSNDWNARAQVLGVSLNGVTGEKAKADKVKMAAIDKKMDWRGNPLDAKIRKGKNKGKTALQVLHESSQDPNAKNIWTFLGTLNSSSFEEQSNDLFLALPAYGRGRINVSNLKKEVERAKMNWNYSCPSFEVWIAMTGYDPSKVDGGPTFQKMCHYLLVDGQYSHNSNFVDKYFEGSSGELKKSLVVEVDPVNDTWKQAGKKGGEYYAYVSEDAKKIKARKGGFLGYNNQGIDSEKGAGFTDQKTTGVEVPVSIRPGSKANWLRCLGISFTGDDVTGNSVLNKHGVYAQQFSSGTSSGNANEEIQGVMAMGNRIASIIGLYYYDKCNTESLNWLKTGVVEGREYHIRMRLPNPNYERSNTKLYVKEPLNSASKAELNQDEEAVIGTLRGFPVDAIFSYRDAPLTHLSLLLHPNSGKLVTIIAPFFGSRTIGWTGTKQDTDRKYINEMLENQPEFPLHTPEEDDGLLLGWKMSKALWLYPHASNDVEWTTRPFKAMPEEQFRPGFMNPPRWSGNNWRDGDSVKSVAELFEDFYYLRDLFMNGDAVRTDNYDDNEYNKLRRYVLFGIEQQTQAQGTDPTMNVVATTAPAQAAEPQNVDIDADDQVEEETPQTTYAEPETMQDVDDVTGSAGQGNILRSDQEYVAMDFGGRGIGVASLEETLEFDGDLAVGSADKKQAGQKVDVASKFQGKVPVAPGAEKASRDVNKHYTSPDAQPWPHQDIYFPSKTKFKKESANNDAIKEYSLKYGTVENLYLHSSSAKVITGVEVNYGLAKPPITSNKNSILDERLDLDTPLFRKNLMRILLIYYHDSSIGINGNVISAADKRLGMLNGIFAYNNQGAEYKFPVYSSRSNTKRLWKPVFSKKPPDGKKWRECFDFNLHQGQDKNLLSCMDSELRQMLNNHEIKSEMTVREWVTSPWHYSYLPYQPQKAVFADGETYSEGCRRCSRPFFEFEELYAVYKHSEPLTRHWPSMYWQRDNDNCDPRGKFNKQGEAPQPFHFDQFWDNTQTRPKKATKEVTKGPGVQEVVDQNCPSDEDCQIEDFDGNWHNWPTFRFKMPICEQIYRNLDRANDTGSVKPLHTILVKKKHPATFRKYYNHVYDTDRKFMYETFPQGRLTLKQAKVKYGQQGYRLQRASKFGNCCLDCAAVLETAPGLFYRNYRIVKPRTIVRGNDRQVTSSQDWWLNMLGRVGMNASGAQEFAAEFLHGGDKSLSRMRPDEAMRYKEKLDGAMMMVRNYINEQNRTLPGNKTKFLNPPDIHVQNAVKEPKKSEEKTKAAIESIRKLILKHDARRRQLPNVVRPAAVDLTEAEFDNPAFRDLLYEILRKYEHREAFTRGDNTKLFDPNQTRKEYRNVKRGEYLNCLEIRQWNPTVSTRLGEWKKNAAGVDEWVPARKLTDYETTVYYATRKGPKGIAVSGGSMHTTADGRTKTYSHSQWAGDGYITEWKPSFGQSSAWKPRDPLPTDDVQTRELRQSRLFITYSLHRPVTSEEEARFLMERMANAAHTVFGDDRFLSQLLVFGQRLREFGTGIVLNKQNMQGYSNEKLNSDTLSSAHYTLIDAPRKKEKLDTFYASATGSSYVFDTYETHVDKVDVDGGIEIGPVMKHPHFHILVTINHWTYIQIDYFKMNHFFELLFRGQDPYNWFEEGYVENNFMLIDASGGLFYTDNEQPYVDIRLYPQDNWQEIITAYVRKNSTPSINEAIQKKTGPI